MIRFAPALSLLLLFTACGGRGEQDSEARPAPSARTPADPALPGDRRLLSRAEVAEILRIPLPPGEITNCLRTEITLGVWFRSTAELEEIVTWFRENLEPLVPGIFKPLPAHRTDRWATRELQFKVHRMAQFEYADGVHQLNVTVLRDERESHSVISFDKVLRNPPKLAIPPRPR